MEGRPDCLSLDLAAITFFASGSITALIAAQQAAATTHTDLDLINVPRRLRRVLDLAGMAGYFRIQPSAGADG